MIRRIGRVPLFAPEAGADHGAAAHNEGIADIIMHHVRDAHEIEIFQYHIPLPHLDVFGIDISITKHIVMMWIVGLVIILITRFGYKRNALIPKGFSNILEIFVEFVRDDIVMSNFGKAGKPFVPYFLTVFFFVLGCNLLGLIPFASTATSNINVTGALAVSSFLLMHAAGIYHLGFFRYVRSIVPHGVPLWLYPIMLPVEIMGMFIKPFALAVRLFANMSAGHIVILALILLLIRTQSYLGAPIILGPLAITLLEVMIAFIQAYIFTTLTAIFVSSSMQPH